MGRKKRSAGVERVKRERERERESGKKREGET